MSIPIAWLPCYGNWGDQLNKILCKKISRKKIRLVDAIHPQEFCYYNVGSVLGFINSSNCEVWGSGFISKNSKLNVVPKKIHSVRGPLTRQKILEQNLECPEIYGDPALLYPMFYMPFVEKKYKYGIIPHYFDQQTDWILKYKNKPNVKIINVLDPSINKFVIDVNSCEIILSSSLHGIICGDSYGIPSYWIKLSDNVFGEGFKFMDYFLSVKRKDSTPLIPKLTDTLEDLTKQLTTYNIDIDLDKLFNACPFKNT
ncbi:MAG: polysaccharide pyruvyl transferase family protein [Patescibacteria group bacterium]|nr:polysaccharide pyruvyl transferase family protein [Patescibacteria group bacterium]